MTAINAKLKAINTENEERKREFRIVQTGQLSPDVPVSCSRVLELSAKEALPKTKDLNAAIDATQKEVRYLTPRQVPCSPLTRFRFQQQRAYSHHSEDQMASRRQCP